MRHGLTTWAGRLLVAAGLVVLVPFAALANICDEETPGSVGAEYDRMFPGYEFKASYELYQEARDEAGREAYRTRLRKFVVSNSRRAHALHLDLAPEQGFDPAFVIDYEDALAWGRALCEPGGEEAYAEHLAYLARPDEVSQRLAELLEGVALSLDHPQANYDFAMEAIEDGVARRRRMGFGTLHLAAELGHVPAQETIANLYAEGRVVPRDGARAYYWYIQAQRGGADVDDRLAALDTELLPQERARADDWLSNGRVPWIN